MAARHRRALHRWADGGIVTLSVMAFIGGHWILGCIRFAATGPWYQPVVLPPAVRSVIGVAVPPLLALIAVWAAGDADASVRTGHPWFPRMAEEPWADWDARNWAQKLRITRRRQTVSWVFAVLAAAAIFVPRMVISSMA